MDKNWVAVVLMIMGMLLFLAACGRGSEEVPELYEPDDYFYEEYEEEEYEPYIPRVTRVEGYFTGGGVTERFFWDEAYFAEPAFVYNHSLATMSLALAMTTFASPRMDNIYGLLSEIGFADIEANGYFTGESHADSMGVVAAHRYMRVGEHSYTLIAVATRGGNYGDEWVGNVTVGAQGYHEGFRRGSEVVWDFLEGYVARHRDAFEGDLKIWMTGFSRAAAVAGMAAARLSTVQEVGGMPIRGANIFAYTFATPKHVPVQMNRASFGHIHNIINPADVVSWVAPPAWGFGRYGVDHVMPPFPLIIDTTRFDGITLFPPGVNFVEGQQPTVAFMHEMLYAITAGAVDRARFAGELQEDIQALLGDIVGGEMEMAQFDGLLEDFMGRLGMQNAPAMLRAFLSEGMEGLFNLAAQFLFESMDDAGIVVAGRDAVWEIVSASLSRGGLDVLLTLMQNVELIPAAHDPLLMLDWLMGRDENFGEYERDVPILGYRRVRVNGPVDIAVFYANGNPAGRYLRDGRGTVYLPPAVSFRVQMTATRRGDLDITAQWHCYSASFARVNEWGHFSVVAGDVFTLLVPFYTDAAAFNAGRGVYTLEKPARFNE
ncbi:MAG: hypothetical protein FWB88_08220 [Defluviitaleaceae bacterium]|nr:hypothetical protein [Defluviitaleaceae bacterium]MCL2239498.1 hypothetical protein [Defluviitaleaceae bacterium]